MMNKTSWKNTCVFKKYHVPNHQEGAWTQLVVVLTLFSKSSNSSFTILFNTLLFAAAIADKMYSALIQPFGQDSFWRTKSKQQHGLSTPPPYDWVHSHFKETHVFP